MKKNLISMFTPSSGVSSHQVLVVSLAAVLSVLPAHAQHRRSSTTVARDGLVDYIDRISAKAAASAIATPGSLWSDSGRLANMVTD